MMSVTSPPPVANSASSDVPRKAGSDQLIEARIEEACRALWWAELVRTVLRLIVFSIAALMLWVVMDQWIYSPGRGVRLIAFVGVAALLGAYLYRRVRPLIGSVIHPEYAARSLEHDMPELRQSLTSYVTLRKDRDSGTLQSRVVKSIGSSTAKQLKRHDALPVEATGTLRWWVAATCALVILLAYAAFSPKNTLQSAARLAAPIASIESPRRVSIKDIEPGDADAIAGRSVKISATIRGLRSGEEAFCLWDLPTGRQELLLRYDEGQRTYIGELQLPHSSSGMVPYVISAGDASSRPFHLTVQDVPVVALESVEYTPPKYTGQAPFTSRSGAIAALDGTTVKILSSTNRTVAKAKIEFNPRKLGQRVQATAGATDLQIDGSGTSLSVSFPLRSGRGQSAAVELENYRIVVADSSGQENPDPIVYPIRVISDLPPEVSITVPASSPKEVPINAQQVIEVHASDPDYGLKTIALEIRSGIDLIDEPVLWQSELGEKGHRVAEFALRPADLDLRIGDSVAVVAVATDNRSSDADSNVEPNVVRTDPVTLKITATGLLPDESDPNADGLSSPEERSSEDESSSGEKGDESGEQQSGGGGSGEGGKQQAGDQGEGGSSGQGSGGESEGQQSSGGGSGGESDPSNSNEDKTGSDDAGGSAGSQSESGGEDSGGDMSSGDGSEGDQGEGNEPQPSESNDSDGGDESETSGGGESGDQGPSGQSPQEGAGGSSESGNQDGGEGGQGSDNSEGSDDSGASGSESGSGGEPKGTQGSQGERQGTQGESGTQGDSGPQQAPKHDGEAFERIKEYMEKKAQQQSGDDQSDAGQKADNQAESNDQQSGGQSGQQNQNSSSDSSKSGDQSSSSSQSDSSSGQPQEGAGDQSAGDQSAGDQSAGDQTAGDQRGSGDDRQTGDSRDGGSDDQEGTADDAGQTGEPQESGDQGSGESGDGKKDQGGEGSGSSEPSPTNEASDSAGDQTRSGSDDGSVGDSEGQPSAAKPGEPGATNTTASSSSGGSEGDLGDVGTQDDQPPPPPDPVNVDYAKKATDLVLDYLDQNREAPDPQLLEDLQWSKEDLQRFSDRWRDIREMSKQPGAEGNGDMEEALQSLGLRPKNVTSRSVQESGDTLGGIRDSGNRKPPPPAFRDAFDTFRRAVGRGK